MVTPSAHNIYNKEIRYHKSEFITSKPSKLEGRVICLPYKIEKVLPILKHRYLDNLIEAEQLETESARLPEKPNWKQQLRCYADSEYFEKVDEILNTHGEWQGLVSDDLAFAFKFSLKVYLNRLLSTDRESDNRWRVFFREALLKFSSFDRFIFTPSLGMQTPSFPPEILLEFHNPGRTMPASELAKFVRDEAIPIIEDKMKLVNEKGREEGIIGFLNRANSFIDRINRFGDYLDSWSKNMSFIQYYDRHRDAYPNETEDLMRRFREFETVRQNAEGQASVREIIVAIERREIRNIYGGDILESL